MADLGKMKVEEDIPDTHREVLLIISGWLGQGAVVTWLSGKERLMGKFTKVAIFGHPPSLREAFFKYGCFQGEAHYLITLLS